jgi:methyl-accepting chemotaxis protein PixJ
MQNLEYEPAANLQPPVDSNRSSDLDWLFTTASQIHQSDTLKALLDTTVTEVRQHFQADRVLVYRFQTEAQGIVVAEAMAHGYTPSLGHGLPALTFGAEKSVDYRQQSFVTFADGAQPALNPYQRQLLEKFQVKASLGLPIVMADQVWGLLVVQHCDAPRQWTEAETSQLYQIVTELRLTLQPVAAREQLQTEARQKKTLFRMIEDIRQAEDLDTLFQTATRSVLKLLACDRASIYRFNADWTGDYVAEAGGEITLSSIGSRLVSDPMDTLELGRYSNHETQVVNDVYQAGEDLAEVWEALGVKAYVSVPIFSQGKLWGLLTLYQTAETRIWRPFEISLLQQLSLCLGGALKQVETVVQLQTKTHQLTQIAHQESLVTKVIERIRKSPDLSAIFNITAREIRQFLNVDRVAIFKFDMDYSNGKTIAEDVRSGYTSALEVEVIDHCFSQGFAEEYRQGRICAIPDIYHLHSAG